MISMENLNYRLNFLTIVLLVLFCSVCQVYAAQYYVSPTGSDSNIGSIDYPYATIGKAVSMASASDTIYLRGGQHDYSSTISLSTDGSPGNPITLRAYQDEVAIVDFTDQPTSSGSRGIDLGGSYWYLYDFIIQNAGDNGLYIDGTNNTIELIIARWNEDSGIQLHTGAADNLILNCDSYENYDPGNHGENADGFATKFGLGTGNILRGCRSWANSDDGYDCWNTDPPSEAVTYDHCWAFQNGINIWGDTAFAGDGNGFKLGAGVGAHLLINCVAYDNPHNGIDLNGNTEGVFVYNCTAVQNGGSNYRFDEYNSANVLRNNISYLGSNVIYAEIDDQYNSWNGFTVTTGDFVSLDSTGIDGDREPDGSQPSLSFLHLAGGSDLIDGGTDVGLPYEGTAPDLGAYEYASQVYPPAAPTGLAATIGFNTISLDWDDNSESDLTGYNIYRSENPGGPYTTPLNGTLLSSSDYVDTDVVYTTTYYYVVTAENDSLQESDYSSEVSAKPTIYGDFIINYGVDEVDLEYLIGLWLENDCGTTALADLGGDCVINFNEFSAFSLNWMLDIMPPTAPTGLVATAGDVMVTLDWDDNTEDDLDSYNVYRSALPGIFGTALATGVTLSNYTDITVVNGETYYYVITAIDTSANESDYSNIVFASPEGPSVSITIQENETGYCGVDDGGSVDSNYIGYTGDGFVNTENAVGEGIDWSVNIGTAGNYNIIWKYANGGGSDRPGDFLVDSSTVVSGISFPATTDWTTWHSVGETVYLTVGSHTLRLEAIGSDGLANIDYIMLSGADPQPASCP